MLAVADASPLIFLARLGHLDLIDRLYRRVVVPEVVLLEATRYDLPGRSEILQATGSWLEVWRWAVEPVVTSLALDAGEAAALSLALELGADEVLIDERKGRVEAGRLGLMTRGTFGCLVQAKRAGLIDHVGPLFDRLQELGARVHPRFLEQILEEVGEDRSV